MSERPADKPDHNVYTVLVMMATIVVAGATAYLAMRHQELFGSIHPFAGA